MALSKEEFVGVIKEIREVLKTDECAKCLCPNIRCELHGDCYNCIRVYRHFGHHVPRCLQFVLDKKIASITKTAEKEMGKRESERGGTHDTRFCYMGEPRFLKVESIMEVRESLRMPKQWEFVDKIREDLGKAGVIVEDTPDGPKWQLNQ